jgi:hypothetical protein
MNSTFLFLGKQKLKGDLMEEKIGFRIALIAIIVLCALCSNALAGCGKWVIRDNTDYLMDPLTDMNDPVPSLQNSTSSKEIVTGGNIKDEASLKTKLIKNEDLSGKWTMLLKGKNEASLDLILIQSSSLEDKSIDRVSGYGNFLVSDMKTPITGSGLLSNNTLSMDLKQGVSNNANGSNNPNEKYVLKLSLVDNTLRGRYEKFSSDELVEKGNATATRFA